MGLLCREASTKIAAVSVRRTNAGARPDRGAVVRAATWTALAWALVGCAGSRAIATDSAAASAQPGERQTSARWVLHPEKKLRPTAALRLADGSLLEVDAGGLRWLSRPGAAPEAAPFGAPESLVGLILDGSRWAVLGQTGTLYFFDQPLGPFDQTRSPPQKFVRTRVVGENLLAINSLGQLFRSSDRGQHYARVPGDGFFSDVGGQQGGDVYAVTVPEQWYRSVDGGAHFALTGLPSIAPAAEFDHENGVLLVPGLFGRVTPRGSSWAAMELRQRSEKPRGRLPIFARVTPLLSGSAVLDDAGYVRLLPSEGGGFQLERGAMDRELTATTVPRPNECESFVLGGRSEQPFLLCSGASQDVSPELRLYRLSPSHERFELLNFKLRGALSQAQLRGSADGQLALSGVCAPHASELGCSPYGLLLVQGDTSTFLQLPGQATLLDFGFDEQHRMWALAQRQKDQHVLVLGPFVPPEIPASFDVTLAAPQLMVDEDAQAQLILGQPGLVTVVAERWGGQHIAQLSDGGGLLTVGRAPLGSTSVHGTGKQLAAVDGRRQVYWESSTGGLVWNRQTLPVQVCSSDQCEVALRCTSVGCLVGDELVRLGYQGAETDASTSTHPVMDGGKNLTAAASLSCRPTEQAPQVHSGLWSTPGVNEALLGNTLWSTVLGDEARGTASLVHVGLSDLRVQSRVLFAPTQSSQAFKLGYYPQVEGSALLRYPVALGNDDLQGPIEIAWDNRIEGITGNAMINVGLDGPGASVKLGAPLAGAMLSVAGPGLFVAFGEPDQADMYYLSSSTAPRRMAEVNWPKMTQAGYDQDLLAQLAEGARQEAVVAHGQLRSLLLLASNRVVVSWLGEGAATPYLMGGLTEMGGASHQVHIAYRGQNVGFLSLQVNAAGETIRAEFVELGGDSAYLAPTPAALPRHLPRRPEVCSAEQRATTPRVIVSRQSEHSPRVLVHGIAQEPVALSVEEMVLFGSPQAPCVGAYGASAGADPRADKDTALIVPELSGGSFLFRTRGASMGQPDVTVQPMSCSFE